MHSNDLENRFICHPPKGDQADRYERLRALYRGLAYEVNRACPESSQKTVALADLQQSLMWANAAIAGNE